MSIIINIFTFQKQLEAIKALEKLEQLQDENLLNKFVLVKDLANKPDLIDNSKDGFKPKVYFDHKSEAGNLVEKLSWWDTIKSFGLDYQDPYIEIIEKGLPAGKAILVVFAYADWEAYVFKNLASLECGVIQAPMNPDITPPEKIAALLRAEYQDNATV